jgi:hypothetical protein
VSEGKRVLRQAFKALERELPERVGLVIRRLRHPDARWIRIPVGILSVIGGIFSFLPAPAPRLRHPDPSQAHRTVHHLGDVALGKAAPMAGAHVEPARLGRLRRRRRRDAVSCVAHTHP